MIETLRNGTDVAASTGVAEYEVADTSVRGDQIRAVGQTA
jgi:hypothetical protein